MSFKGLYAQVACDLAVVAVVVAFCFKGLYAQVACDRPPRKPGLDWSPETPFAKKLRGALSEGIIGTFRGRVKWFWEKI